MRFWAKNGRNYIDRRSMYTEVNRNQKVSKQRKLNSLQDGYIRFSKILDFDSQNFKKQVFLGKLLSNPKFSKLKKSFIYTGHTWEWLACQISNSYLNFWPPNYCNKCEMWWLHKNKSYFWSYYRHRTQKQITPLDSWDESESEKGILFSFFILKIDPFWTFLTWPAGQILKLPFPLDYTTKITYITCVAWLSCSFPLDDLMWPDRDLGLYLL